MRRGSGKPEGDGHVETTCVVDGYRRDSGMGTDDKIDNKAEELKGKAKEAVGDATNDRDLQSEGQADQASGNLKQAGEKVKDIFKD